MAHLPELNSFRRGFSVFTRAAWPQAFENHGQVCFSHPLDAVLFTSRCTAPCPTASARSRIYGTLSPNQSSACVDGDQISLDHSIGDLFRAYGEAYIDIYRPCPQKIKLIRAIRLCKTPYLGGQTIKCKDCGKELKIYHSCGHSQCPICQSIKRSQWQDKLSEKLFAVPYVHTVFTLPHELNKLGRRNPREVYNLLLRSAWKSVKNLSSASDNIGGLPGMVSAHPLRGSFA